jgi:DNA-directed RNA polymerase subunit RPC12/RpoP
MSLHHCTCGRTVDVDDCRYIGAQETGEPGEWVLLFVCYECGTTFGGETVTDAARCAGCGHLVLGGAEDPKTVTEHHGIFCFYCLPDLDALRRLERGGGVVPFVRRRGPVALDELEES